jgi:hypothetical protein
MHMSILWYKWRSLPHLPLDGICSQQSKMADIFNTIGLNLINAIHFISAQKGCSTYICHKGQHWIQVRTDLKEADKNNEKH